MRKILSYLLIISIPFFSFSQEILWEKSYGGIHSEYLFDAQPTADYGFILAGSSLSGKTGNKQQENTKDLLKEYSDHNRGWLHLSRNL